MELVKRILFLLLLLVLAALVLGFLMPGARKIERTVTMNMPAPPIFSQLNELRNWSNWSPWNKVDPNARLVYSEPSAGLNSWYAWESTDKNVGKGKITIVQAEEDRFIKTRLEFDGMKEAYAYFRLEPHEEHTTVTWVLHAEFGNNPIFRLLGPMMDKMLGETFMQGLSSLEKAARISSMNVQPAGAHLQPAVLSDSLVVR